MKTKLLKKVRKRYSITKINELASDEIDSEDQLWTFPIKDNNCSCVVSLA